MIRKIRHKGLKKLYEDDSAAKVNPDHADKLRRILARLDAASEPQDMELASDIPVQRRARHGHRL